MQLTIGAVQAKSVKSVCLKNLMDVCAGGVGYFLFGYAFAYGDPQTCDDNGVCSSAGNPFIGSKMFALHDLSEDSYHIYYFQFVVGLKLHSHLLWMLALVGCMSQTFLEHCMAYTFVCAVCRVNSHHCIRSSGREGEIYSLWLVSLFLCM